MLETQDFFQKDQKKEKKGYLKYIKNQFIKLR